MTNFCKNTLTLIHEDPAKVVDAKKAFEAGALLSYFIPEPDYDHFAEHMGFDKKLRQHAVQYTQEETRDLTRYWFKTRIWGSNHDVGNGEHDNIEAVGQRYIVLVFDTPGSPPIEPYRFARRVHGFDVVAQYWESFVGTSGKFVSNEAGERICSEKHPKLKTKGLPRFRPAPLANTA